MCCMTYDIQQHLTKSSRDCNAHNGHYGGSGAAQRRSGAPASVVEEDSQEVALDLVFQCQDPDPALTMKWS